jgi:hypothetical protein
MSERVDWDVSFLFSGISNFKLRGLGFSQLIATTGQDYGAWKKSSPFLHFHTHDMTHLPTEVILIILSSLSLLDLGNARLVSKIWNQSVVAEVETRVKAGLRSGKGTLVFEVSPDRRAEMARTKSLPFKDPSIFTKTIFKQDLEQARFGYLIFKRSGNHLCAPTTDALLSLSVDIGYAQLIFPDIIGNRNSSTEHFSFHCMYESTASPVIEDDFYKEYPSFGHLQPYRLQGIKTQSLASTSLTKLQLASLRNIVGTKLPLVTELVFDMPVWQIPHNAWKKGAWWLCTEVNLVPKLDPNWMGPTPSDFGEQRKRIWRSMVDGSLFI